MTAPSTRRLIPLLISALLLLACASTAPPPPVAAVTIAPVTTEIVIGASVQLTATTWDASGRVLQGRTGHARVVEADIACRPCARHGGRRCPRGTEDCMRLVTAGAVLTAARAALAEGR